MDPCLEQDLQSKTKPWALSPLISTMPYFAHARTDELNQVLPFPPPAPVQEDTSQLRFEDGERPVELQDTHSPAFRRTYCTDPEHRKNILFGPDVSGISCISSSTWTLLIILHTVGHDNDGLLLRISLLQSNRRRITTPGWYDL